MSLRELLIKKEGQLEQTTNDLKGLWFRGMEQVAPQLQFTTQSIGGVDGEILQSSGRFGATTYIADFFLDCRDERDLILAQQELSRLFYDRALIRFRDSIDEGKCFYGYAKPITFQSIHYTQKLFSVEIVNPSGMRQSIFYCDDEASKYYKSAFDMNSEYENELSYVFTSNRFKVYNPSDIDIDPLKQRHEFKVFLEGKGKPKIRNLTNQMEISYLGTLSEREELEINGVQLLKNGVSVGRDSDFGYLTLVRGWNEFEITNAEVRTIRFHFPFYFF